MTSKTARMSHKTEKISSKTSMNMLIIMLDVTQGPDSI